MAKYDKYAEYKDSGVEWIGEIPNHWTTCSLSKLFSIKAGGDVDLRNFSEDQSDEYLYPIYTNANDAKSVYGYSKVANYKANSITVSGRGEVGFAVYRNHAFDAIIRLLVLSPQKKCEPKFFAYFINEVINFRVESSAIGQLSTLQISPYKIVLPSLSEQKSVVDYLDNETSKIDSLLEKQQQLIELLKEKRQAVISHAVTKGLNPNVSMKDSGVEWLGQVPQHWIITCLARISGIKRGSGYQNIEMDVAERETIQMLRIADMHEIAPALIVKNNEVIRYLVEEGDILVAGTGATAGISMLVPKECHGWVHSYNSIKVKVDPKKVNSSFLQLFLTSDYIKKSLDVSFVGSAQPFVDTNGLGRLRVLLPPLHEQIYIFD